MKKKSLIFSILLWLALVGGGMYALMKYEFAPGKDLSAVSRNFPSASRLALDPARFTLILFAHPQCPCTRASLRELERLTATHSEKIKSYVIFAKPPELNAEWTDGDLKEQARRIPGVEVIVDENEGEINAFGAQTSGLTLLYDQSGARRFRGGITFGRGMEGDSEGGAIINAVLRGETPAADITPTFGCALQSKEIKIQ